MLPTTQKNQRGRMVTRALEVDVDSSVQQLELEYFLIGGRTRPWKFKHSQTITLSHSSIPATTNISSSILIASHRHHPVQLSKDEEVIGEEGPRVETS
jgi:hypothetical protein